MLVLRLLPKRASLHSTRGVPLAPAQGTAAHGRAPPRTQQRGSRAHVSQCQRLTRRGPPALACVGVRVPTNRTAEATERAKGARVHACARVAGGVGVRAGQGEAGQGGNVQDEAQRQRSEVNDTCARFRSRSATSTSSRIRSRRSITSTCCFRASSLAAPPLFVFAD